MILPLQLLQLGQCGHTAQLSMEVVPVLSLEVDGAGTTLPTPSVADYQGGAQTAAGPTARVRSNASWLVLAQTSAATWAASGPDSRQGKPAGDLSVRLAGGPWVGLGLVPATLHSGEATTLTAFSTEFRVAWDTELDGPGTYALTLLLTVVAN